MHFINEAGSSAPQIDDIDVVGDRTLFDALPKVREEIGRQFVARQDRDVDVAVLQNLAARAGAEQPHLGIVLAQGREHHATQFRDRPFANRVH